MVPDEINVMDRVCWLCTVSVYDTVHVMSRVVASVCETHSYDKMNGSDSRRGHDFSAVRDEIQ